MCVPGKLVYLYVGPLPCRRKLYNNDVIYGVTALSGYDRLLRMRGYSASLNGTGVSTGLIICVHTPVIQYGGAWRLPAPP